MILNQLNKKKDKQNLTFHNQKKNNKHYKIKLITFSKNKKK